MSEITQHNIGNKLDTSLKSLIENEWMSSLWSWADEHSIDTNELPRDKQSLLQLTSLTLYFSFFNIGQQNTEQQIKLGSNTLSKKILSDIVEAYAERGYNAATVISEDVYLPKELGMLTHLEELCIGMNPIERLPDEITNLKYLKRLCLCHNVNLVLTQEQKEWVRMLEKNGAEVSYDEGLLDHFTEEQISF